MGRDDRAGTRPRDAGHVPFGVRPTATKVNVIPTTWRRLRIIRAELTIGGKAVRSWQASHEP